MNALNRLDDAKEAVRKLGEKPSQPDGRTAHIYHALRIMVDAIAELRAAPTGVCELCGEVDWLVRRETEPPAPERDRRELEAKLERLQSAALWALGENGEFRARRDGEGAYWWRTEFRKRCGDALPTGGGE